MMMSHYMPTRLIIGEGAVQSGAAYIKQLGDKVLILMSPHAARVCGAFDDVTAVLEANGQTYALYDRIGQNPRLADCMEAAELAVRENCQAVIGIGGGSPMDAAKCTAVLAANPGMTQEELYSLVWPAEPLPIACVGTTAGTGSEVTKVSVITNLQGLKKSFNDDRIYPRLSLGDPRYLKSLSDSFIRSTAVDALAHCVESYFNRLATRFSRESSVDGIRLLVRQMERILKAGTETLTDEDREKLYMASIYGGLAINTTGTCIPHAMGYFLSEEYGVAHGTACARYLPVFLELNQTFAPEVCSAFRAETGCSEAYLIKLIRSFTPPCEVSLTTEDINRLHSRWVNNRSINKCLGELTPEGADEILRELFVR